MTYAASRSATPAALRRLGTGKPILLLHGFGLNWQSWGLVIDDLADEFDVLAPTLPGHWGGPGLDGPPSIDALVDQVEAVMNDAGWPTAHIVGNSLGAWLAFELAERGRAQSVTGVAPAGIWRSGSRSAHILRHKFIRVAPFVRLALLSEYPVVSFVPRTTALRFFCHRPDRVPADLQTVALAAPARCSRLRDFLDIPAITTGIGNLDGIDVPTTLLFCEFDRVIPPQYYGQRLVVDLPAIRSKVLPAVGHVPMLEAPALVAREIRNCVHSQYAEPKTVEMQ